VDVPARTPSRAEDADSSKVAVAWDCMWPGPKYHTGPAVPKRGRDAVGGVRMPVVGTDLQRRVRAASARTCGEEGVPFRGRQP
jgi:hypothetical protein